MSIECTHCGQMPEIIICGHCDKEIPTWAKFCPLCGEFVSSSKPMTCGDSSDMENRCLCPDGNCIGILGADGCCVICGKN